MRHPVNVIKSEIVTSCLIPWFNGCMNLSLFLQKTCTNKICYVYILKNNNIYDFPRGGLGSNPAAAAAIIIVKVAPKWWWRKMEVWFVTRALCLSAIPSDKGIEIRSTIELLFTMNRLILRNSPIHSWDQYINTATNTFPIVNLYANKDFW